MRRASAAAALVLAVTSCGGTGQTPGAAGKPQPRPSPPSPSVASSRPNVEPPGGIPTVPTPNGTLGGSTPAPVPLGTSADGRLVLGRVCVHRGSTSEQQTLTVTASAGETVGYSTYYADYSSELNRPDYTTGFGYGQAGPDGTFRASWVVPATATPGRATVQVVAAGIEDGASAGFDVVRQGQAC